MGRYLVYVAGPLTTGNQEHNVARAVAVGDHIFAMGGAPLIPHLSTLWGMCSWRRYQYEEWMEIDFAYISHCDALVRFPGESSGADREVEYARRIGVPVFFYDTEEAKLEEFLSESVLADVG